MNAAGGHSSPDPILCLRGVGKSYGPVNAVIDVDLDVMRGEVLAICGDNGAGKSSLIKLISGAEEPSSGQISLNGKPVSFRSPSDALEQGVATIYQDLALAPRLSIVQNIFLGSELVRPLLGPFLSILDKREMAGQARTFLQRLNPSLTDVGRPVQSLSGGQRQAVAIARALRWNASIIIMDEPTAALGVKETAQVIDLVRRLKQEGRTVILISHNMRDVVALADRAIIMSAGRKIEDLALAGLTADQLSHKITSH
jgi:simple sugar transport system ATP-binding protein